MVAIFPLIGNPMYAVATSLFKLPTFVFKLCAGLEQPFAFATTVIVPVFVPTKTEIVFVNDDPVHPFGKVHVYELAPLTGLTE